MCVDLDFTGDCVDVLYNYGQCVNVPTGFNDKVTSVGPASGNICTLFKYVPALLLESS